MNVLNRNHMWEEENKCQIVLAFEVFDFLILNARDDFCFPVWILTDIALHIIKAPQIWNTFWTLYLRVPLLIQM